MFSLLATTLESSVAQHRAEVVLENMWAEYVSRRIIRSTEILVRKCSV